MISFKDYLKINFGSEDDLSSAINSYSNYCQRFHSEAFYQKILEEIAIILGEDVYYTINGIKTGFIQYEKIPELIKNKFAK